MNRQATLKQKLYGNGTNRNDILGDKYSDSLLQRSYYELWILLTYSPTMSWFTLVVFAAVGISIGRIGKYRLTHNVKSIKHVKLLQL